MLYSSVILIRSLYYRGEVLKDVLGLEDVLEDTFWCPWLWRRRSSPWPWSLKSSKIALSSSQGQHNFLSCYKFVERLKNFFENGFFREIAKNLFWRPFFWRSPEKIFWRPFFLESSCACALVTWPWPRAFLSLASRGSVLGRAVFSLGLGFF